MYGMCETLSLIAKEENKLRVSENRMLRTYEYKGQDGEKYLIRWFIIFTVGQMFLIR